MIAEVYAQAIEKVTTAAETGHVITNWLFDNPDIIISTVSGLLGIIWWLVRKVNKQSESIATLRVKCNIICEGIKNSNKRIGKLEDSAIQMKEHINDFKDEVEKCCKCNLSPMRTLEVEKTDVENSKTE